MALSHENQSQPIVSDTNLALVVYILYCASYVTGGFAAFVGLIIAYLKIGEADPILKSHYQFQIRTFWIGLLYLVAGTILCLIVIGIFVLIWWLIWSLVRTIKGILALNDRKPIVDPTSWMFG